MLDTQQRQTLTSKCATRAIADEPRQIRRVIIKSTNSGRRSSLALSLRHRSLLRHASFGAGGSQRVGPPASTSSSSAPSSSFGSTASLDALPAVSSVPTDVAQNVIRLIRVDAGESDRHGTGRPSRASRTTWIRVRSRVSSWPMTRVPSIQCLCLQERRRHLHLAVDRVGASATTARRSMKQRDSISALAVALPQHRTRW